MTRKRSMRAKGHPGDREQAAPPARCKVAVPAVDRPAPVVAASRRGWLVRWTFGVLLAAAAAVFCWFVGVYLWWRWFAQAGAWPAPADVGLSTVAGLAGAGSLIAASVLVTLARRARGASARLAARVWLLSALVMGGLFVALRTWELRELYWDGLWQPDSLASPHDHPDIYYVQAVRQRLQRLFDQLEDLRTNHSDQFSAADAQRLELVTTLQANMIGWTEQQVGHWLEDLSQRRGLMEVVAYQVHPLAKGKVAAESALQQEDRDLARQRQWFAVLRDYCRQKSELHRTLRSTSPAGDLPDGAKASSEPAAVSRPEKIELRYKSLEEADLAVREKLQAMGLQEWAFARSVVVDTADGPMTGERLNQIEAQLAAMDARQVFVDEFVRPVLEKPATEGLNQKNRWLRLPVYFPCARRWTGSYLAVTGLHATLLACTVLLSLVMLFSLRPGGSAERWRLIQSCWYAASLIAVTTLAMFYLV